MNPIRVCFTGHRIIPKKDLAPLLTAIRETVRGLLAGGAEEFLTGGALGFDTLVAEEVLRQKRDFPHAKLVLVLPCRDQAARWTPGQRETYTAILEKADRVECLFEKYVPGCMHIRNRYLVDHADVCVAYLQNEKSGTAYTVHYAREKGIRILFIPQKEASLWEI